MDTRPEAPLPPVKPDPGECCGRGCDPCIYDYYERALERWKDKSGGISQNPDIRGTG